jgi:hypothetical protein
LVSVKIRKKKKSSKSGPVFGVRIDPDAEHIPEFVEQGLQYLEQNGKQFTLLY